MKVWVPPRRCMQPLISVRIVFIAGCARGGWKHPDADANKTQMRLAAGLNSENALSNEAMERVGNVCACLLNVCKISLPRKLRCRYGDITPCRQCG